MFSTLFRSSSSSSPSPSATAVATSGSDSQTKSTSLDVKSETNMSNNTSAKAHIDSIDLVSDDEIEEVTHINNDINAEAQPEETEYDVNTQEIEEEDEKKEQQEQKHDDGGITSTPPPLIHCVHHIDYEEVDEPITLHAHETESPHDVLHDEKQEEEEEDEDYDSEYEETQLTRAQQRQFKAFLKSTLDELSSRHLLASSPPSRMTRITRTLSSCLSSSLMILTLVLLVGVLIFHLAILTKTNYREL